MRAAGGFCLALASVACTPTEQRMPPSRHPELHCEPGSFAAVDDEDQPVEIPRPRARATLLDFWASWCMTCRRSLPRMVALRHAFEQSGIDLVLVAVLEPGGSVDDARHVLESWGIRASFVVDPGGRLARRYRLRDLPAAVVLDRKGAIRWVSRPRALTPRVAEEAARLASRTPCSG